VVVGGESYGYRVYLPSGYRGDRSWPVVLFLHGSSERGDDNLSQVRSGLGPAIRGDRERFQVIAVFPQCRRGQQWFGAMEDQAEAALDAAVREFHGDRARLYLTGISLGGSGAWFLARHRHRFAAVVPICGEVVPAADDPFPPDLRPDVARLVHAPDPYGALAAAIGPVPVWVFHGAKDDQVPVRQSRAMVAAMHRLGGIVRYTEYPDLDHFSWDRAYAEPGLIGWLLDQQLR
jgi:predicted peptidase